MIKELVRIYDAMGISAHQLILESLHMIDPEHPELVMCDLPQGLWEQILEFADAYLTEGMETTYRILPARDQVEAAKRWIEERRR